MNTNFDKIGIMIKVVTEMLLVYRCTDFNIPNDNDDYTVDCITHIGFDGELNPYIKTFSVIEIDELEMSDWWKLDVPITDFIILRDGKYILNKDVRIRLIIMAERDSLVAIFKL